MPSTSPEIHWLVLVATATALMWIPHILQLIFQEGLWRALRDPTREIAHRALWAQRARRAHANAIENLAIFAPLALVVAATGSSTPTTAAAATVFFWARIGHFAAYVFAVPYARVILFLVGWTCQLALVAALI
jgi:uncharacterized MAPEG superfamily protein